jgi:putative ATPase
MGLVVTSAAAQAFEYVGLPEGIYPIVEAVLYLATAEKSNTTSAYFSAYQYVERHGKTDVPSHLQDSHRDKKVLGHGEGYLFQFLRKSFYCAASICQEVLGVSFYLQVNGVDKTNQKKRKWP